MAKNNSKNYSVKIASNCTEKFDLSIVTYDQENFRFNFANIDKKRKTVNVDKIAVIPAGFMKHFLDQILDSLIEYEKEYGNGNGLDLPE